MPPADRSWVPTIPTSGMFLAGMCPTVDELLYGLLVQSGNDAAVPLAHRYDATRRYTYNGITQSNRNRLLWLDPSVDGMKTGHTKSAGYSLVATARRPSGNLPEWRLISVVIGTASDRARTEESRALLEWGFRAFEAIRLYAGGEAVGREQVWKGALPAVAVGFDRDVYLTVPAGARVETALRENSPLMACGCGCGAREGRFPTSGMPQGREP